MITLKDVSSRNRNMMVPRFELVEIDPVDDAEPRILVSIFPVRLPVTAAKEAADA
jgi:hypothetical protein